MKNLNKTDIGLIGLAVMGENLALNMAMYLYEKETITGDEFMDILDRK